MDQPIADACSCNSLGIYLGMTSKTTAASDE